MTEPSAYPLTQADAQQHLAPRFVGHPVVLFVGRFAPEKNLTRWIDVAKQIYARDANVRFVLVGDGPQRPEIERLVRTYGLEDVIALSGALPYSELPAAYAAADVFLLTSNHEGFGRVLIEAAFAGVPVVATRCGGPEGVIVDGETGYLRDTDDVSGLTEAVWSLLSDRGRANRVAAAARGRARSIFGLQSVVDALIECWQVTAERADRCVDIEEHSHKVPGSSSEVSCGSP
jgi:glycogen(starch) synthase